MNGKCPLTLGKIQYQNLRAAFESVGIEMALLPSEGTLPLHLRAEFELEGKYRKKSKQKKIFELFEENTKKSVKN